MHPDKLTDTLMRSALRDADRREHLSRHAIPCPVCGSDQVQIIDQYSRPALWRCRKDRRHRFEHEPD